VFLPLNILSLLVVAVVDLVMVVAVVQAGLEQVLDIQLHQDHHIQ
jgi:hypothetical protein